MISRTLIFVPTVTALASIINDEQEGSQPIRNVMDQQVNCWNKGDIDCFMKSYWQSDSLMFIGQ